MITAEYLARNFPVSNEELAEKMRNYEKETRSIKLSKVPSIQVYPRSRRDQICGGSEAYASGISSPSQQAQVVSQGQT
jgi:hypothetical protein